MLEYQTAISSILDIISRSKGEIQPVFDAIVQCAARLFCPCTATITTLKNDLLHWNGSASLQPAFDIRRMAQVYPIPFDPVRAPSARAMLERRTVVIPDAMAPDTPEFTRMVQAVGGFRSITFVPLVSQNKGIGAINLTHPQAGFELTEKQIELLQTFADQAVIAIENTRLFEEVQARTRELTELLEYQTATSEVLSVISRSKFDLQPVLDSIARVASTLCSADDATILTRENNELRMAAHQGSVPIELGLRRPINRDWVSGRAVFDQQPIHVSDLAAAADEYPLGREIAKRFGHRTTLAVPLIRQEEAIGCLLLRRLHVQDFEEKQIELLKTFADQAVVAIENTRLFEEIGPEGPRAGDRQPTQIAVRRQHEPRAADAARSNSRLCRANARRLLWDSI